MALKKINKSFEKHVGINDQLQTLKQIEDDHLVKLTNFNYIPATQGRVQLKTREGTSKDTMSANITGTNTGIKGIHFSEFTTGTETIFVNNGVLYTLADPPEVLISGVSDVMNDFAYYENKVLIFNALDAPIEMNKGEAPTTLAGSPPTGGYVHVWKNHVFVANITGDESRIDWCLLGDKDTWPATNRINRPYGTITGISSLGDQFFIFFKNKIEVVTGYSTNSFIFDDFADKGCISHHGIVSNGSTLFFPSQDGIYAIGNLGSTDRTVGGSSLIKISPNKIANFWSGLDLSSDLIHGIHDPDRYLIRWSVRREEESNNDRELVYNYHENVFGFAFHTGRTIGCYALGKTSSNNWDVKYGDSRSGSNGGIVYRLNTLADTDDGEIISGVAITKAYDFDMSYVDKKFNTVTFLMKGTDNNTPLKVSYGVGDFPGFTNTKTLITPSLPVWDTAKWDIDKWQEDTFKNYSVAMRRKGKSMVMKLVSDESGKGITIGSWRVEGLQYTDKTGESNI
jgi:hypothetical protein